MTHSLEKIPTVMTCKRALLGEVFPGVLASTTLAAQAAPSCEAWNRNEYFKAATLEDATACLDAGADLAAQTKRGHTPLHRAAKFNENPAVVEALLAPGADLETQTKYGETPLHRSTPNVREVAAAMPGRRLIPAIAGPVPSANPATVDALLQRAKKRWSEELAECGSAP